MKNGTLQAFKIDPSYALDVSLKKKLFQSRYFIHSLFDTLPLNTFLRIPSGHEYEFASCASASVEK